jgi:hypothetical protein
MDARYGESLFEELRSGDIYVEPVKMTLPLKNQLVYNLAMKLDQKKITGPYIEELVQELEAYTYRISYAGNTIYEAPSNFQDDCVTALILAASMLKEEVSDWIVETGLPLIR